MRGSAVGVRLGSVSRRARWLREPSGTVSDTASRYRVLESLGKGGMGEVSARTASSGGRSPSSFWPRSYNETRAPESGSSAKPAR